MFASFGQVYEEMTPISMLRTVAGIGLHGKLYVPHLLKELKPAGVIRQARGFQPLDSIPTKSQGCSHPC